MELWAAIWQGSASVGGGIALAFIVALALGMIVLTVLYCASAVVVLEGFARVSTGMTARVASGAGAGFVASAVFLQMTRPELGLEPWSAWWAAMGQVLGPGLGLALLAMGAVSLLLKRVDSSRGGGLLQLVALLSGATLAGARGLPELPLALAMALACGLAVAGFCRSTVQHRRQRHSPDGHQEPGTGS